MWVGQASEVMATGFEIRMEPVASYQRVRQMDAPKGAAFPKYAVFTAHVLQTGRKSYRLDEFVVREKTRRASTLQRELVAIAKWS